MNGASLLKMGDLVRLWGVSSRAVRLYERMGLLQAVGRTPAGYRIFDPEAIQRLLFIRKAQTLGFSLEEIRSLTQAQKKGDSNCESARRQVADKIAELEGLIQKMKAQQACLWIVSEACERCEGDCVLKGIVASLAEKVS